jgi:hypothetical protein
MIGRRCYRPDKSDYIVIPFVSGQYEAEAGHGMKDGRQQTTDHRVDDFSF